MYIKNIELQGFKSFLKKTNISLKRGITAVVGPNGCGKTNIIDAVRWVLGEQKHSMLRSAKMEDVIFNGTQKVKPTNFCQVKLTIENDFQILPIEYSEIEISRRLFRTGESQYYINKNLCRLKDVHELFIDTGMGSDAYSVIELKMIETILSHDSSNFKRMLDEAAGISNYNHQRKNTKNKLKHAMNDLDRINDIIYEVDKNIKSLNLQMKRYKRHEVLIRKLSDKEILFSALKITKLGNEEKPILEKLKSQSKDESLILKKITMNDRELKKLEVKENLVKNKIIDIKSSIELQNHNLTACNTQIVKFTENEKYNNSKLEYHKDQIYQLDINAIHISKNINDLKQNLFKLDPTIKSQNKKFNSLEKGYLKNQEKHDLISKDIKIKNKKKQDLFSDLSKLKNKKRILESNFDSLTKHLVDLEKFKYDKNCKYCIENGREQIFEKGEIKNKLKDLKKNISSCDLKRKSLSKKYNINNKELDKLNKDLNSLNLKNEKEKYNYQDLKIKNIELIKEKEAFQYRLSVFLDDEKKSLLKVKNLNNEILSLTKENKDLNVNIEKQKKSIAKIQLELRKNLKVLNKFDNQHLIFVKKLKNSQNDILFNQRKKEEKIIDKQNLEIKVTHIQNEKKIISNFIKEKYNSDIYNYLDIKNTKLDMSKLNYEIEKIKRSIDSIGPINMAVNLEYEKEQERFNFLNAQRKDILDSEQSLQKSITKLDKEAKGKFIESFNHINDNLDKTFSMFFSGGTAFLKLTDKNNPLESNVEIVAKPPGKRNKTLKMLSAGEKALSATAILFAIYLKKPSPFCILDEIDSPLDDSNIKRFTKVIRNFSNKTQFIIITHNKLTMQESDYMYGITQENKGISNVVSVEMNN